MQRGFEVYMKLSERIVILVCAIMLLMPPQAFGRQQFRDLLISVRMVLQKKFRKTLMK